MPVIGTITTSEPTTVTESYETASWSKVVTVPPGTYEVEARTFFRDGHMVFDHSMYARMTGTITAGSMRSRLGPSSYGKDTMVDRYGTQSSASKDWRMYFPVQVDANLYTVEETLKYRSGTERTIERTVCDLSDVMLPSGMVLNPEAVKVGYTFVSIGVTYAALAPRS